MNAAIAPSSDLIQQLLYCTIELNEVLIPLTNDQSHNEHVLFQLKLQLLE